MRGGRRALSQVDSSRFVDFAQTYAKSSAMLVIIKSADASLKLSILPILFA
jgi:hypothetical protein